MMFMKKKKTVLFTSPIILGKLFHFFFSLILEFCAMFKKVHNVNNPRKLITAKKSLNGQTAKINTREMQFFSKMKKPQKLVLAKISTIKVYRSLEAHFVLYLTLYQKYITKMLKTPRHSPTFARNN